MNINSNTYFPNSPWANPFDNDNEFDIQLYGDSTSISYEKEKIFIHFRHFLYIKDFLESDVSDRIKDDVKNGKLKVVFIGDDSYPIFNEDVDYIKSNDWFFKNKNVQLWVTNYNDENSIEKNLYVGTMIHYMLQRIINCQYEHSNQEFTKHFITLNNKDKPDRVRLYDLYKSLDSNNFIASFNFEDIFLQDYLFNDLGVIHNEKMYDTDILKFYKQCLFEIVCESGQDNVTEKSYKPLLLGVPFIPYSINVDNQLEYFKHIGIDINYFDLDFTDINNVNEFIRKITSMSIDDVRKEYDYVFVNAQENRTKIKNYFNYVKDKITNL